MKASHVSAKGIVAAVLATLGMTAGAYAEDLGNNDFKIGGYLRTWASFNLQDHPETVQNDKGDLSMLRGSLFLEADAKFSQGIKVKAITRLDRELRTNYLKRLDELPGQASNLMDQYNQLELRELYVDAPLGDRVNLRFGKQQVVWGETDFFRAMDVVHGFDFRWRSFLEGENEELRKPLILANAQIQVPEAHGSLQLIARPGLDRNRDIGNTFDLSGGRWANQPNKGVDFFGPAFPGGPRLTDYDYRHPKGNTNDTTYGFRWQQELASSVNYSLIYMKTFNNDPVVNPGTLPISLGAVPYMVAGKNFLGDFIYPKIDVYGVTASTYTPAIDAVLSTEVVYNRGVPFNVGSNFLGGTLPGFAGIALKDTLVTMFRMDKQIKLQSLIGSSRPSFFSVQFFNTHVLGWNANDDIVSLAGFGLKKRRDSAILTTILAMNYNNDRVNPTIAAGWDATYSGGFFIPSVEFVMGDNWRLKAEADIFFNSGKNKQPGQIETNTGLFGYFANNNQLVFRLTRQF